MGQELSKSVDEGLKNVNHFIPLAQLKSILFLISKVSLLVCVWIQDRSTAQTTIYTLSTADSIAELKEQIGKVQKDRDDLSRELLSCKAHYDQLQAEHQEALLQNSELQHKHKKELEELTSEHKEALDKLAHDKKMEREVEMASEV